MLPRAWFELQLLFAARAAAVAAVSFEEALRHFTTFARRFGLEEPFDAAHPVWQEYLRGLRATTDTVGWTHLFDRARAQPSAATSFGCFSYHYVADTGRIRLHFINRDESGRGPLSQVRLPTRLAELRDLFTDVARHYPQARTVRGNSWLHGLGTYRRLYPPEYGATAIPAPLQEEFTYMALWGQFLDHQRQMKDDLVGHFLADIAGAQTVADLAAAFPHPVFEVESPIEDFYRFYGVAQPARGAEHER